MLTARVRRLAVVAVLGALVVSGCSGGGDDENVTLTIATFGDFGYEKLLEEYEKEHPNLRIESRVTDFETHHQGLTTQLAGKRGAADVVAIEEQYMPQFQQSTDEFVNLADFGAADLRERWTPWKWDHGVADGGKFVMGLGTDMGSLAICYRRDLYQRAGLPTDRDDVAELWPTWEKFTEVADEFSAKVSDAKFVDSAGTVYTAIINQSEENYFAAKDDSFIADTNPNVRRAFELAGSLGQKEQTAEVTTFTQPWNVAIKQSKFATITCPAWMLTLIEEAGGAGLKGKWDVTSVPEGGGNWGGSYLTVPAQSEHKRKAYELAEWLTAPEQQKRIFTETGQLPSSPDAFHDRAVRSHTDDYFNDAPVGKIFAASADKIRPNYRGLQDAAVRPTFGRALGRIEEGDTTIEEEWAAAVAEATKTLAKQGS